MRQKTSTSDMIWTVRQIIEHLSRGRTLRAGTVIMTGTPSGVALFMGKSTVHYLSRGGEVPSMRTAADTDARPAWLP